MVFRPCLPITFRHGTRSFPVGNAFVDTGADVTLLPVEIAKYLAIELRPEAGIDLTSAGGGRVFAVPSATPVECAVEVNGRTALQWKGIVHFAPRQPAVILGFAGCLEFLDIQVSGRERSLDVRLARM
jgi:predicted aspartyl protease